MPTAVQKYLDSNNLHEVLAEHQAILRLYKRDIAKYEKNGAVLPMEVKSGKDYHRHNTLSNVMSNQNYQIPKAVVFSNENFSQSDKVMYLPVYMAMFIEKQLPVDINYKVDLQHFVAAIQ